jgi:hypothetical protein
MAAIVPSAPAAAAPAAPAEGGEDGQLPDEDAAAAAAAAAAALEPEYMFEAGCIELPRQAGLYKLAATYMAQQQRNRAAPGELGEAKWRQLLRAHKTCRKSWKHVQLVCPVVIAFAAAKV